MISFTQIFKKLITDSCINIYLNLSYKKLCIIARLNRNNLILFRNNNQTLIYIFHCLLTKVNQHFPKYTHIRKHK